MMTMMMMKVPMKATAHSDPVVFVGSNDDDDDGDDDDDKDNDDDNDDDEGGDESDGSILLSSWEAIFSG